MSLNGSRVTLGHILFLSCFVLLFIILILLPKFVKPRFWIPIWIVPYILICFCVWSKIGCYHETVINKIEVIKDFTPLPIVLRLIVLVYISFLPYICIVFFAPNSNKYIDDQTKAIKPWKILLRIFIYIVTGMIIITLTILGISLVGNNYGAVFIFGPLLFQGIIIPIIFLLLLPIISMVFIYFIKWFLSSISRLFYIPQKYYPANLNKVGYILLIIGIALVSGKGIMNIISKILSSLIAISSTFTRY